MPCLLTIFAAALIAAPAAPVPPPPDIALYAGTVIHRAADHDHTALDLVLPEDRFLLSRESLVEYMADRHDLGACHLALIDAETRECQAVGGESAAMTLSEALPWIVAGGVVLLVGGVAAGVGITLAVQPAR